MRQCLGKGSYSTVHRVKHEGRVLACKRARNPQAREHLIRERDVLTAITPHPNIVTMVAADEGDILLDYIDGMTLETLSRRARLPDVAVVHIACEVLRGLAHVHASGFAHCDVKPENVIISRNGEVKIVDFGSAQRIGNRAKGERWATTMAYVSPELIRCRPIDGRVDLYSVGVILYELITRQAYRVKTAINEIVDGKPPIAPLRAMRPEVLPQLDEVVACLLAPNPDSRFADAVCAIDAMPYAELGHSAVIAAMRSCLQPTHWWPVQAGALATVAGCLVGIWLSEATALQTRPATPGQSVTQPMQTHTTAAACVVEEVPPLLAYTPPIPATGMKPKPRSKRRRARKPAEKLAQTARPVHDEKLAHSSDNGFAASDEKTATPDIVGTKATSTRGYVKYHDLPTSDPDNGVIYHDLPVSTEE